jgi:uncharacterized protein YndB with AHSA1/START domain
MSPANTSRTRTLVVARVFNAPIDLVWRTWTDPELVMQWWGPDFFTCPFAKMDVREGGTSIVCMRAPKEYGGQDMFSAWKYRKIVPMKSLEFTQHMADRDGNRIDPKALGLPAEFPSDTRTIVTFEALSTGETKMVVSEFDMPTADSELGKNAEIGLNQSVDKMKAIFANT